jgi:hypothetical protein
MNPTRSLVSTLLLALVALTCLSLGGCGALGLPAGNTPEAQAQRDQTLANFSARLDTVATTAQAAATASAATPGLSAILASVAAVTAAAAGAVHVLTNTSKTNALAQVAASKPTNGSG